MDDNISESGGEDLTASTQSLNDSSCAKPEANEIKTCCDCKKTFKSCSCKSCAKCGALFQTYFGTPVVKGRSHCRICCAAVCITCHVIVYDTFKICTRCHIKQKEDELSTQMALSAIVNAKSCSEFGIENLNLASTNVSSQEKKNAILISASKKGDHHVVSTILSAGAEINHKNSDGNTALFFASRGAYLPCMALLIEKGADCSAANKFVWTPLHALACYGRGENVVECADLLIQMGAMIFAMTDRGETAGDLAEQSGHQEQLVAILRAAEVEEAIRCLYSKMSISELGKERETWKYLKTLLKVVTDIQKSQSDNEDMLVHLKLNKTEEIFSKTGGDARKTLSLNRVFSRPKASNQVCQLCGQCSTYRGDVEPVVRTPLKEPDTPQIKEQLDKCQQEKDELEKRCKKLMNSIGAAANAREKQELEIRHLKKELGKFREEKDLAIQRCEATCTNKLTKIHQEADFAVHKAQERLAEVEKDRQDLLHLQSLHKLTWIPDKIVSRCMNTKCRAPFSQTRRRHHCRCCGRVFCSGCSSQLSPLEQLGYSDPVRMCNQCFALLDETFVEVGYSENDT